jgi:hypothetical protein
LLGAISKGGPLLDPLARYEHSLVHIDTEGEGAPSLAVSLFLSSPFTSAAQCAVHVHAYDGGRRVAELSRRVGDTVAVVTGLPRALSAENGPLAGGEVHIAGAGIQASVARAAGNYRVVVDSDRLQLDLEIVPSVGAIDLGSRFPLNWGGADGYIAYRIDAPLGSVSGTLSYAGQRLPMSGRAYMDEQWGSVHYAYGLRSWQWYRADIADGRLYLMRDHLRDGRERSGAIIVRPHEVRVREEVHRRESGESFTDIVGDFEIRGSYGPYLQDDDLSRLSSGRVERFTRRELDLTILEPSGMRSISKSRVGAISFGEAVVAGDAQ